MKKHGGSAALHEARTGVGVPESDAADGELIRRIGEGDLAPLGVLYDRYHADVRQFIARATSGGSDTDDLAHDTFLTLSSIAARYDGRATARPFLIGIAARLDQRRHVAAGSHVSRERRAHDAPRGDAARSAQPRRSSDRA